MIEVAQADIDLAESDGKYYVHTDKSIWYITTADTYADIGAARTGLDTTNVQFKKATPIITQLTLDEIYAFASGTLYNNSFAQIDYSVILNYKAKIDSIGTVVERIDDDAQATREDVEDLQDSVVIEKDITLLSTGWTDDTGTSGYWYYQITDTDVSTDTIVDYAVHLDDLEDAVALNNITQSFSDYYRIYAYTEPTADIVVDVKKVR